MSKTGLLTGKRALVTGGASGIGRAIVKALAGAGARIAVTDKNGEAAAALAKEIGGGAISATLDVTSACETAAVFDRAFETFWRRPAEGSTGLDLAAMGEKRRFRRPAFAPAQDAAPHASEGVEPPDRPREPPLVQVTLTYSAREVLRHKDFAELTAEDLRPCVGGLRVEGDRVEP